MDENEIIIDQILSCIVSKSQFKEKYTSILEDITHNSKDYIQFILDTIFDVLMDEEFEPLTKFYALLLLVKATETKHMPLMVTLAENTELLTKIFEDAQFDKEKPLEEKGHTYFHKQPSKIDSQVGKRYIRLIIEAMKFWSDNFASTSQEDPLSIYTLMYNNLTKQFKFPDSYIYIGKENYDIEGTDGPNNNPEPHQVEEDIMDIREQYNVILSQVVSCIASGAKYKQNSKVVFDAISRQNNPIYFQDLLTVLIDILDNQEYPPRSKFYTLYLLVQITETRNKYFLGTIAQKKSLLNRFYREAKIDKDLDARLRGQGLFPDTINTPDAIIGRNYRSLVLEAIKYWDVEFGNAGSDSILANFKTLAKSVEKLLPTEYNYIGKRLDPEGLKGSKSLSKLNFLIKKPEESSEGPKEDPSNQPDLAQKHFTACYESGRGFLANFPEVLATIQNNPPPAYFQNLLTYVQNVLVSKYETPVRRFYGLYFLVKLTEVDNADLILALSSSKDLLNKVFQDGQFDKGKDFPEKGDTIFTREPTVVDKVFGNGYVVLILEALKFWSDTYGAENKSDLGHIFKIMYSALTKKEFKFPERNSYVGVDINKAIPELERRLNQRAGEGARTQQQEEVKEEKPLPVIQPQKSISIEPQIKSPKQSKEQQQPKKTSVDMKEIQAGLKRWEQTKVSLKEFLMVNPTEYPQTEEVTTEIFQELQRVHKNDIDLKGQQLANDSNSEVDPILEIYVREKDFFQRAFNWFSNYKSKKINYEQFRAKVLEVYGEKVKVEVKEKPRTPSEQTTTAKAEAIKDSIQEIQAPSKLVSQSSVSNVPEKLEPNVQQQQQLQISNKDSNQSKKVEEKNSLSPEKGGNQSQSKVPEIKIKPELKPVEETQEEQKGPVSSMKKLTLKSPRKDKSVTYFPDQDNLSRQASNQSETTQLKKVHSVPSNSLSPDLERVGLEDEKVRSISPKKELTIVEPNRKDEVAPQKKEVVEKKEEKVEPKKKEEIVPSKEKEAVISKTENKGVPEKTIRHASTSYAEKKEELEESILSRSTSQRRKIPEDKLKYSLHTIAQSINLSNVKNSDLDQIHQSIKASYLKSGKDAPTFEPLAEMKKKEKLEQEIAKLKAEKLNLSKETLTMQSQINIDSSVINDEELSSVRDKKGGEKPSRREQARDQAREQNLRQKVEDLQKKVEETSTQLQKKEFELENAKKVATGTVELDKILKENTELKMKVNKLTQDVETLQSSKSASPSKMRNVVVQALAANAQDRGNSAKEEEKNRGPEFIFKQKVKPHGNVATEKGTGAIQPNLNVKEAMRSYLKRRENELSLESDIRSNFNTSSTQREFVFKHKSPHQEQSKHTSPGMYQNEAEDYFEPAQEVPKIDKGVFGLFKNTNELTSFKLSSLLNSRLIYEDEDLQIGFNSILIRENPKTKKVLKSVIYYGCKTDKPLENFGVYLGGSTNLTHFVHPEHLENRLVPGKQLKQQVISTIVSMPFEAPALHGDYRGHGKNKHFSAYLPLLVSRFMEFKPISYEKFEEKWAKRAAYVIESDAKALDPKIVETPEDFSKYFEHLIEVSCGTEQLPNEEGVSIGGIFELDLADLEYMVRIFISASHKVVFQVAGYEGDHEVTKQILDTLVFLFEI